MAKNKQSPPTSKHEGRKVWKRVTFIKGKHNLDWNQLPDQYKAAKTGHEFKMKVKSWKGFECTCRICI